MAWCLTLAVRNLESADDEEIDVIYSEHATIGQKIALTERIIRVLQQLKCPASIEPHQIQGLDCIHIYPVVQWLVRLAIDAREARSANALGVGILRAKQQRSDKVSEADCSERPQTAFDRPPPIERYYRRRPDSQPIDDDAIRLKSVLFEYGE